MWLRDLFNGPKVLPLDEGMGNLAGGGTHGNKERGKGERRAGGGQGRGGEGEGRGVGVGKGSGRGEGIGRGGRRGEGDKGEGGRVGTEQLKMKSMGAAGLEGGASSSTATMRKERRFSSGGSNEQRANIRAALELRRNRAVTEGTSLRRRDDDGKRTYASAEEFVVLESSLAHHILLARLDFTERRQERELYGDNPALHPPRDSNYTRHGGFNVFVLETALIRRRLDMQRAPSGGNPDHYSHVCAYILHTPDHYTALVRASGSWELWNGGNMVQTITAICDLVREEHDDGVRVDEVVCGLGRGVADGDKTRGGRSGEDSGGTVVGRWVTNRDKTRGSKGGEDGKDEVRGGEVAEANTRGAVAGETRRGDSAGGNAGMATNAMEEHTKTEGNTTAVVATDAMEEHTETKGDTAVVVTTDAMDEHTETNGDPTATGRVALAESIVEATKADGEEAANRKGVARVTNGMEGVITTDEDAGAADAGNEEEVVIGVTGAGNEEGAVTGVVRGHVLSGPTITAELAAVLVAHLVSTGMLDGDEDLDARAYSIDWERFYKSDCSDSESEQKNADDEKEDVGLCSNLRKGNCDSEGPYKIDDPDVMSPLEKGQDTPRPTSGDEPVGMDTGVPAPL
ncbi:hypothetical protein CBR_g9061 [Chara braunii]|uniref:Uncharacterized protein n=1 Tax=Chara braunii TaxID=69332 RepID=A0A388KNN4_CHABU|nr:hypothetical protein CBR_g9061 [Chara braunii]|eukprot:GBG71645.1 hypothetical protein CBR_g9061 [Chara braunii]